MIARSRGQASKQKAIKGRRKISQGADRIRKRVVEVLKGVEASEEDLADWVRSSISGTVRGGGNLAADWLRVVNDIAIGVLSAAAQEGMAVVVAAKAVTKGVILGVADLGGDVVGAAYQVTRASVQAAADLGADVGMTAWRGVHGVVEAGAEIGANIGQLLEAATKGAVEGSVNSGHAVVRTIEDAIAGVSDHIRSLMGAGVSGAAVVRSKRGSRGLRKTPNTATARKRSVKKSRNAGPKVGAKAGLKAKAPAAAGKPEKSARRRG